LLDDPQTKYLIGQMPELQQSEPSHVVPLRREPEPSLDTGLSAAFGQPPAADAGQEIVPMRRRGRPAKASATAAVNPPSQRVPQVPPPPSATDWEESDSELDATVSALMNQKVTDMLK
jgi:hypothetical protein